MDSNFIFGMVECLLSTVLYGSAFVPLKPYNFGDGIFSLQLRSIAVLVLGVVTTFFYEQFHFYPIVMIGGAFWTIANLIVLPCIGELGLGVTVLLYSFTNCLTNWFTGYFGLFWTKARPPNVYWLNYIGLAFLLVGGTLIAFVRSTPKIVTPPSLPIVPTLETLANKSDSDIQNIVTVPPEAKVVTETKDTVFSVFGNASTRRIIATAFALLAGFFYGENVTPVVAVQDHPEFYSNPPQDGLSYCFSHFLGIFCTASIIFFVYSIAKKNRPFVSPELTVPSFLSGLIWGVAQTLFIVATKNLSQSVSGPIGAIFPGCIASCWSVFYFKEIKGTRGLLLLTASIVITGIGATCIAISKNL